MALIFAYDWLVLIGLLVALIYFLRHYIADKVLTALGAAIVRSMSQGMTKKQRQNNPGVNQVADILNLVRDFMTNPEATEQNIARIKKSSPESTSPGSATGGGKPANSAGSSNEIVSDPILTEHKWESLCQYLSLKQDSKFADPILSALVNIFTGKSQLTTIVYNNETDTVTLAQEISFTKPGLGVQEQLTYLLKTHKNHKCELAFLLKTLLLEVDFGDMEQKDMLFQRKLLLPLLVQELQNYLHPLIGRNPGCGTRVVGAVQFRLFEEESSASAAAETMNADALDSDEEDDPILLQMKKRFTSGSVNANSGVKSKTTTTEEMSPLEKISSKRDENLDFGRVLATAMESPQLQQMLKMAQEFLQPVQQKPVPPPSDLD